SCRLAFQVRVDPFFEFASAFVGGVEADSEGVLGVAPGNVGADPDAGEREEGEGDFDGLARADIVDAFDGHAPGADFERGGGDLAAFVDLHRDFGDDRDADVAAGFGGHGGIGV